MDDSDQFDWHPQPEATAFVVGLLEGLVTRSPAAQRLSTSMHEGTGTRLLDWMDHIASPSGDISTTSLREFGFSMSADGDAQVWRHAAAMLPPIVVRKGGPARLAVKVESVVDFLAANKLPLGDKIMGEPWSRCRIVQFARDADIELRAVERHGHRGIGSCSVEPAVVDVLLRHQQAFRLRDREREDSTHGFQHAAELIEAATSELDRSQSCDLFFAAEREYWQSRNRAARVQKARQDRLGLGWANHDHHTYRSSREHFHRVVAVLEQLGFVCRERFYAGREAGWGAQVLEQTACGITVFADVDLGEEEVLGDFAHEPLEPRDQLGTVGLWCKLHGEAFLEAGMHHLECQFDFDAARQQLASEGIETMAPFTDFPHLRQAFTAGEMWTVDRTRIAVALESGWINHEQADRFDTEGAIGSHLEILERNDGYKGFNQIGISEIIKKTDPRHH